MSGMRVFVRHKSGQASRMSSDPSRVSLPRDPKYATLSALRLRSQGLDFRFQGLDFGI